MAVAELMLNLWALGRGNQAEPEEIKLDSVRRAV
jgi:hypothetical protein